MRAAGYWTVVSFVFLIAVALLIVWLIGRGSGAISLCLIVLPLSIGAIVLAYQRRPR